MRTERAEKDSAKQMIQRGFALLSELLDAYAKQTVTPSREPNRSAPNGINALIALITLVTLNALIPRFTANLNASSVSTPSC